MAELEEEMRKLIEAEQSKAERRRDQRFALWMLAGFSVLAICYLIWKPSTFSDWRDWLIVGAAILCSIGAIVFFQSMRNNWTTDKEERLLIRALSYMILGPISFFLMVFGWWAALTIVLIVVVILLWAEA